MFGKPDRGPYIEQGAVMSWGLLPFSCCSLVLFWALTAIWCRSHFAFMDIHLNMKIGMAASDTFLDTLDVKKAVPCTTVLEVRSLAEHRFLCVLQIMCLERNIWEQVNACNWAKARSNSRVHTLFVRAFYKWKVVVSKNRTRHVTAQILRAQREIARRELSSHSPLSAFWTHGYTHMDQ